MGLAVVFLDGLDLDITNNAKDFEPLHRDTNHAGLFLFYNQRLQNHDPEGLARVLSMKSSTNTEPTV